ncbi:MAG: metal-dependent transcriptional regulator [Candidatus Eisenbacteria bacterium]
MADPLTSLLVVVGGTAVGIFFFWPGTGLFARWRRGMRANRRVLSEDALKYICKCEAKGEPATVQGIAGNLNTSVNDVAEILQQLEERRMLFEDGQHFRLTDNGRQYALNIIRAHRLYEHFLAEKTGYREEEWHERAERREHRLTPAEVDELDRRLGSPTHDPHGDPIPTPTRDLVFHGGRPLTTVSTGGPLRIVHLEDEPETVYAQIAAIGLRPGMTVLVTERTKERIRFWADGNEHVLAPIVAANIAVAPLPDEQEVEFAREERLSAIDRGETAEVIRIARASRGPERRRLMDLGVLPGTRITREITSPSGGASAYRIRGALIALRDDQAVQIHVRRGGADETEEKEAAR